MQNNKKAINMKQLILFCIAVCLAAGVYAQRANETEKPKMFYHLVDSVGIGNSKGLKLCVASTTGDTNTFNRIFGILYDPLATNAGKQKRAVDVVRYEPDNNLIKLTYRNENGDFEKVIPSSTIKAFLEGKGSATMAEDANITILPTRINKTE